MFIFLGALVAGILTYPLRVGLTSIYHESLKDKKVSWGHMFKVANEKCWVSIQARIILFFILFAGGLLTLAFIVLFFVTGNPAVFFSFSLIVLILYALFRLLFSLVTQAIVISKKGAVDSIFMSFRTVKKNFFEYLGLVIIFAIAAFIFQQLGGLDYVGFLFSLILAFVVTPIANLVYTDFYMKKNEKKI